MKKQTQQTALWILSFATMSFAISPSAWGLVTARGTTRVELQMSNEAQKALKAPVKTEANDVRALVEKDGIVVHEYQVSVNTRGQTSLKKFPRKNMSIHLEDTGTEGSSQHLKISSLEGKSLILSAGAQDPLLVKNMIGYRLLDLVKVPALHSHYAEVVINQKSEGLYMVTESPDEFLTKKHNADVVIRRRYNDVLELKKANKKLSQEEITRYQNSLNETYEILKTLKGEKLLSEISSRMNLDHYMRWLAVNYLIQNGDYSDEVFFFGSKDAQGQIKFDIMPWDMDDSFQKRMHLAFIPGEFNAGQEEKSQKQMLYSFESQLDQAISQDSVLLKKYFEVLDQVTQELNSQKITSIVDQVMAELYPYLNDSDILAAGAFDESKAPHDADAVFKDAAAKQELMKSRLAMMQKEIQVIKSENIDRAQAINRIEKKMGHFILKVTAHFAQPKSK